MWEIKQSVSPDALDMYIYDDVEGDRMSYWGGKTESETSANHFRRVLEEHQNIKRINIYINSRGGAVFEGTAIYNQLRRHPAEKVVYIDGHAGSIASVIAMAGDRVVMPKNTVIGIHNMWMYCCGNAAELRKLADDLDVINAAGRSAYMEKSRGKITEEKLIELMNAETYLTAEQCIEYGFADEYSDKDADMSVAEKLLEMDNLNIKQRIAIQTAYAAQLRELTANPTQNEGKPKKHKFDFIK